MINFWRVFVSFFNDQTNQIRYSREMKHLTINQQKEIICFSNENKYHSSRTIAKHFSAKFDRKLHHGTIVRILKRDSDILFSPEKNGGKMYE